MSNKAKKIDQITVRLTVKQAEFLDQRAKEKGPKFTRSKVIRSILDKAIAAKKFYSK